MSESECSRVSSERSIGSSSESEDGEIERQPKKRQRKDRGHGYRAESYNYYQKVKTKEYDCDEENVSSDGDERSHSRRERPRSRRHSDADEERDEHEDDNNEDTLNIKPPQARQPKSSSGSGSSSRKYASHRSQRELQERPERHKEASSSGSSKHHRHHYSSSKVPKEVEENPRREHRRREEPRAVHERDREKQRQQKSWMVLDDKERSGDHRKMKSSTSKSGPSNREVVFSNQNTVTAESRRQMEKQVASDRIKSSKHLTRVVQSSSSSSMVKTSTSTSTKTSTATLINAKKITSLIEVQEVEMSEEEFEDNVPEEKEEENVSEEEKSDADDTASEEGESEAEENEEAAEEEEEDKAEGGDVVMEGEKTVPEEKLPEPVTSNGNEDKSVTVDAEEELLPPYLPAIQGCRSVEEFHCLNRIEEGTYGVVYRARDKRTDEIVALKRLKMEKEKEGFPITSLREINTLLKAQHINIVTVREIVVGSNIDKIYIVMEYVEHDLKSLMETMKQPFLIGEVKTLMIQLLRAVAHLHNNWILHRDLKTSNLLLNHRGILKVGDFGLAREYGSPLKAYTPVVVTLWYRAPELLLQTKEYSTPIDVWSVGCIFGEFLTMKPLFPAKSEIDQLNLIFKDLGSPNEKIWPGYSELPLVKRIHFQEHPYNNLQKRFTSKLSSVGFDLINRFLTYCPERRITAEDALKHDFFKETPMPVDPSMFPTWPAKSEQSASNVHVRKAQSPKPPSGGKQFAKQMADDDDKVVASSGFHMSLPNQGKSAKGIGFSLKF